MSVHAMSWAKKQRTGSATRKLVLLTIADYANDEGVAWPSQRTLAQETELADRSIRRALVDLEKRNLLRREKRPPLASGQLQSDRLHLHLSAIGQNVRWPQKRISPADSQAAPPDTVSAKPSRNIPYQEEELTYQDKALGGDIPSDEADTTARAA